MSSPTLTRSMAGWGTVLLTAAVVAALAFAAAAWATNCSGDCSGGPGSDLLDGSPADQTMSGEGSDDQVYGRGGKDNVQGNGGATDYLEANLGNSDRAAGGPGVTDISIVWQDAGTDYAYGGENLNDYCYVDVTFGDDNWDTSCEIVKKN